MAGRGFISRGGLRSIIGVGGRVFSCVWRMRRGLKIGGSKKNRKEVHFAAKILLHPSPVLPSYATRHGAGPFVYRLGRQVFNLERGVRFPYGLPLFPLDKHQFPGDEAGSSAPWIVCQSGAGCDGTGGDCRCSPHRRIHRAQRDAWCVASLQTAMI